MEGLGFPGMGGGESALTWVCPICLEQIGPYSEGTNTPLGQAHQRRPWEGVQPEGAYLDEDHEGQGELTPPRARGNPCPIYYEDAVLEQKVPLDEEVEA